jgi:hypothetical protein
MNRYINENIYIKSKSCDDIHCCEIKECCEKNHEEHSLIRKSHSLLFTQPYSDFLKECCDEMHFFSNKPLNDCDSIPQPIKTSSNRKALPCCMERSYLDVNLYDRKSVITCNFGRESSTNSRRVKYIKKVWKQKLLSDTIHHVLCDNELHWKINKVYSKFNEDTPWTLNGKHEINIDISQTVYI